MHQFKKDQYMGFSKFLYRFPETIQLNVYFDFLNIYLTYENKEDIQYRYIICCIGNLNVVMKNKAFIYTSQLTLLWLINTSSKGH